MDGAAYLDPDDVVEEHELDGASVVSSLSSVATGAEEGLAAESVHSEPDVESDADDAVPSGPDTAAWLYAAHTGSVYAVASAALSSGRVFASGSGDDAVHLWDAPASGERQARTRAVLRGHTDTVTCVAFSSTGTWLATGGLDAVVRVWSVSDPGVCVCVDGPTGDIEALAWHPRGDVLLAASADATAWMWSVEPPAGGAPDAPAVVSVMAVFAGHEAGLTCVRFTGNGKSVATAGRDACVRVWNPKTGGCIHTFAGHGYHEDEINALACASDKPLILTGSQDGTARLVNYSTLKVVGVFAHPLLPVDSATSELGTASAAAAAAAAAPGAQEEADAHPSIEAVAFVSFMPWFVAGATDGTLIVWDIVTGAKRHTLSHSDSLIRALMLEASLTHVCVTTSADGFVTAWDVRDGRKLATHTGHAGMVLDVIGGMGTEAGGAAVPWIVTAGDDRTCRLYSLLAE